MHNGLIYITQKDWKEVRTYLILPLCGAELCLCLCLSGFLRSDKPLGTALVRLEQLESHSEVREIVEVRARHSAPLRCPEPGGWNL